MSTDNKNQYAKLEMQLNLLYNLIKDYLDFDLLLLTDKE